MLHTLNDRSFLDSSTCPGPHDVLVRLLAAGICHTGFGAAADWGAPSLPCVFGREAVGVVEAVGDSVSRIRRGDQVLLNPGSHAAADDAGTARRPTAALVVHERSVTSIARDMAPATLAPFGYSVRVGAGAVLDTLRPGRDDRFAVFGADAVGMAAVMGAKLLGVGTILVVDPLPHRRALALDLGATCVLDPLAADVVAQWRQACPAGVTHALDTTGSAEVVRQALSSLSSHGRLAAPLLGDGEPQLEDNARGAGAVRTGARLIRTQATVPDLDLALARLLDLHDQGLLPVEDIVETYLLDDLDKALAHGADGVSVKPVLVF